MTKGTPCKHYFKREMKVALAARTLHIQLKGVQHVQPNSGRAAGQPVINHEGHLFRGALYPRDFRKPKEKELEVADIFSSALRNLAVHAVVSLYELSMNLLQALIYIHWTIYVISTYSYKIYVTITR